MSHDDAPAIDGAALAEFLSERRWFTSGKQIAGARVIEWVPLLGEPALAVVLVEVSFVGGTHSVVQLLVGTRERRDDDATIAADGQQEIYEALTAPAEVPQLVARIRASTDIEDHVTTVECRAAVGAEAFDPMPTTARTLDAQQSNTSVVLDERMILKAYRRLEPGVHPELEVLRTLEEHGFTHAPRLFGWYACHGGPIEATLGVLQEFRPDARDGWEMALELLRDEQGDRLVPRLADLGTATGVLHATLAAATDDPAFAPEEFTPQALALMCATLDEFAIDLIDGLPSDPVTEPLRRRRDDLRTAIRNASNATGLGRRIRTHGDLHLGQALWSDGQWVLIDFEGEPARPIHERRRKHSPLRDVAGLMRSVGYVAAVADREGIALPPRWESDARDAVLTGYLAAAEPSGLMPTMRATLDDLLGLYELEKAVYELQYEREYRPDWVDIPVAAILAMIDGDA